MFIRCPLRYSIRAHRGKYHKPQESEAWTEVHARVRDRSRCPLAEQSSIWPAKDRRVLAASRASPVTSGDLGCTRKSGVVPFLYRSQPRGTGGTRTHKITYTTEPGTPTAAIDPATNSTRTTTGFQPSHSAMPPQTPPIQRCRRDRRKGALSHLIIYWEIRKCGPCCSTALKGTEPEFIVVLISKGFVVRKSPYDAMVSSLLCCKHTC